MLTKQCKCCHNEKPVHDFFQQEHTGLTGMYCKQCHAEWKIKHGYGSYGDRWQTPDFVYQITKQA